jgi:hypothetical protein
VTKVERDAASSTAKITCIPAAGPDQNRQVLVLAQEAGLPPPPADAEPRAGPAPKQKRPRKRE